MSFYLGSPMSAEGKRYISPQNSYVFFFSKRVKPTNAKAKLDITFPKINSEKNEDAADHPFQNPGRTRISILVLEVSFGEVALLLKEKSASRQNGQGSDPLSKPISTRTMFHLF